MLPALEVPKAPTGLRARGKKEWELIWTAGKWLWPSQDYAWVEQACRAYDDIETFRKQVLKDGLTVQGYKQDMLVAHPLIAEIRRCEATIRTCLSALGFSPTDRARLKLTELRAESELQSLVRQPDDRTREYQEGW